MSASVQEGGATYGQIGWGYAYELCSFYSVKVYLPFTRRTAAPAHPAAILGELRGELGSGCCWQKLKTGAG